MLSMYCVLIIAQRHFSVLSRDCQPCGTRHFRFQVRNHIDSNVLIQGQCHNQEEKQKHGLQKLNAIAYLFLIYGHPRAKQSENGLRPDAYANHSYKRRQERDTSIAGTPPHTITSMEECWALHHAQILYQSCRILFCPWWLQNSHTCKLWWCHAYVNDYKENLARII